MISFECDAFVFDVDGTLVDSAACVDRVWTVWANNYGMDLEKTLAVVHGRTVWEALRIIEPPLATAANVSEIERRYIRELENVEAVRGAKALLARLPAGSWAVATSGTREISANSLRIAGLPVPAVFIAAEDVQSGKPDPEPYLKAAKALGVAPGRCMVFEDSHAGIASANRAGATVIALATLKHEELAGANGSMRDFRQVKIGASSSKNFRFQITIDNC